MAYNNNNRKNSNDRQRNNDEVSFDLMDHIAVISNKDNGWTKEVNVVAWNGGEGKIDVREWDPEHKRCSRGITLFDDEAEKLTMALADRYKIGGEAMTVQA